MSSRLELVDIILPPGFCLGPKPGFSRCLPRELPWCAPLEWLIWVDLTLSGISLCLFWLCSPWNLPSWARKVLIGHQNQVTRSVTK